MGCNFVTKWIFPLTLKLIFFQEHFCLGNFVGGLGGTCSNWIEVESNRTEVELFGTEFELFCALNVLIKVELFGSNRTVFWIHKNNPENTFKNNQNISVLNISSISVGAMISFLPLNSRRLKRFSAPFFLQTAHPKLKDQSPPEEILSFNKILHLSLTKTNL